MRAEIALIIGFVWLGWPAQAAEPPVKIKTYPVSGRTGFELFQSIGENAPNDGGHIAQTQPKLIWNRLFDERGGNCYLVHALPQLSFEQIYPKPTGKLPPATRLAWDSFIAAIRKHEDTHVARFKQMVAATEMSMKGMFEPDDRTCAKIKASVRAAIDSAYENYRVDRRAFDRDELGPGGALAIAINNLISDR